MAAVILAGRTGSAYAAELGTMTVNEEVDALRIMGIDPIAWLVLPRLLAAMLVMPVLALLMNLAGLARHDGVMGTLGFPPVAVVSSCRPGVGLDDLAGGLSRRRSSAWPSAWSAAAPGFRRRARAARGGRCGDRGGGRRHRLHRAAGRRLRRAVLPAGLVAHGREPSAETVIRVDDLAARFDGRTIFEHVSFEVRRGEVFVILGGSGCGKSRC